MNINVVIFLVIFSLISSAEIFNGRIKKLIADEEGVKVIVSLDSDSHSSKRHSDIYYLDNLNLKFEKISSHLEKCHQNHQIVKLILEKKADSNILFIKDLTE